MGTFAIDCDQCQKHLECFFFCVNFINYKIRSSTEWVRLNELASFISRFYYLEINLLIICGENEQPEESI